MDVRPCLPENLEQLITLLDEEFVFSKGRMISLRQRFPTVFCRNNLHNIIICTDSDEIVSALAMRQFDWREGSEIFRGAMIGMVYTHPARRGEGLASRLMATAVLRLREDNVDFGVLWTGQSSFYTRLGWVATDCSVLGELKPDELTPEPSGKVTRLPAEAITQRLEEIRHNCLSATSLRHSDDYRQLPIPAESVNVLWCEDRGKAAYALSGSCGETGFLYELVGDVACFPSLWKEICCCYQRIFINDQADSLSCRWLTDHTVISWKNKNLAMWLPLSERLNMLRLGQWHIPYFDRI